MSNETRRSVNEIQPIARRLLALLQPAALRIEIAGSLRRGKETIADIELVAVPLSGDIDSREHSLCQLTDKLLAEGVVEKAKYGKTSRWGTRYRGMLFEGVKCELFVANVHNWGYQLWLRTGPDNEADRANTTLISTVQRKAPFHVQNGFVWAGDQKLSVSTEKQWFTLCGLPFIEPHERTAKRYYSFLSSHKHKWGERLLVSKTRVVKFQDVAEWWDADGQRWLTPEFEYIGRAMPDYALPPSPYGNPFKLEHDTERELVLKQYRDWLYRQENLINHVDELRGKTLVCWCRPNKVCHGDVLAELADGGAVREQQTMFNLDDYLRHEWEAAVKSESEPKERKRKQPFRWCAPWLTPDGDVWVYVGYGDFELMPQDDERAQLRLQVLDQNPVSRENERRRLTTWLELRAAEAKEDIEIVVENLIGTLLEFA